MARGATQRIRITAMILSLFLTAPLSAQKWDRLCHKFDRHYDREAFSKALEDARAMKEYTGKELDSTDIRFVLSDFYMAKAYRGLGELDAAREYVLQAYRQLAPNMAYDEEMAGISLLYGQIETALGYHKKADMLIKNALDISLERSGPESLPYLLSLYALADLQMASAQWDAMAGTLVVALQIHERNFPLDRDYAIYANYLGLIFMNGNREEEALLYLSKSLSAYRDGGIPEDLTCANAYNNLGLIYYYQSAYKEAEEHFDHAALLYEKFAKGYSENYMMLLSNRASLYYSQGDKLKMGESYLALGEYLEKYSGRFDLPYIQGLENMAHFYASEGNFEQSESCFLKASDARKKAEQE